MLLRFLPILTGLLPILAIHLSLAVAILSGTVPSCIPYIEGCTSISATGRYPPASFIFKPSMTVEAVLMTAYWLYNGAWLAALSRMSNEPRTPATPVGLIGCAGALALILYVTFLGTQEPFYEFMRRFGIYFYFLFTIVAQLLLARRTIGLSRTLNLPSTLATGRLQFALAVIPFGLSALNLVLKNVLPEADTAEKVIEWIVALLMHCFFVASYFAWRETGYRADLTVTAKHR